MVAEDPWKYLQIADDLRARIRAGEYAPGALLPSRADLRKMHDVSGGPVAQAINLLEAEGLIYSKQGSGTFVSNPLPQEQPAPGRAEVMSRVDALAEEVRQLKARMDAFEQERVAESQ